MREPATNQEILNKGRPEGWAKSWLEGWAEGWAEGFAAGRQEEARNMLVRFGTPRFGPPPPAIVARLASMTDIDALESLADRMWAAGGWDDLLGSTDTP